MTFVERTVHRSAAGAGQRNLLYTAITRSKKLIVLVGPRRALAAAVRTIGPSRRHTTFTHRLDPIASPAPPLRPDVPTCGPVRQQVWVLEYRTRCTDCCGLQAGAYQQYTRCAEFLDVDVIWSLPRP